jgi:hypothetical protein
LLALVLCVVASFAVSAVCEAGSFASTGSMAKARSAHTATLLPNGKVLVAGGVNDPNPTVAELYDPALGTWSATGSFADQRWYHTATLLPNGKVLLTGGLNSIYLSSAELYDAALGTWSATGALAHPRFYYTATLLPNGKVLVVGGYNDTTGELSSAELYDPALGTWSATGSLASARYVHTATLLPNGKVLVAGGVNPATGYLASAEIYDPALGTWSATGSLANARYDQTATLLADGKVLVAGGYNDVDAELASAELYDPALRTWSATGALTNPRYIHTATLLANGKVLVAGGINSTIGSLPSAEIYDPAMGTWSATGSFADARYDHTSTLLANGKVLVAGGAGSTGIFKTAELYDSGNVGDFDLDGKPDILLQNRVTGETVFWLMDGTNYQGWSGLGVLLNPAGYTVLPVPWQIAGKGDFDLDGKPDVILQNSQTGETLFWLMDGTNYKGWSGLGVLLNATGYTVLPVEWAIAGSGDFDLDGKVDILLRNSRTGETLFWLMDGTNYKGWSGLGVLLNPTGYTVLPVEWRIAGTGDFDLDGKADMILQNSRTGEALFWFMNGLNYKGWGGLGVLLNQTGFTALPVEWRIADTGDFDLNGKPDIILQNSHTGETLFWLMDGPNYVSWSGLGVLLNQSGSTVLPVEWRIMK